MTEKKGAAIEKGHELVKNKEGVRGGKLGLGEKKHPIRGNTVETTGRGDRTQRQRKKKEVQGCRKYERGDEMKTKTEGGKVKVQTHTKKKEKKVREPPKEP